MESSHTVVDNDEAVDSGDKVAIAQGEDPNATSAAVQQTPWLVPALHQSPQMMVPWQQDVGEALSFAAADMCFQPMMWLPAHPGGMDFLGNNTGNQDRHYVPQQHVSGEVKPPQFNFGHKHRFCATYPTVERCRHGIRCAFAHTREEVAAPLLTVEEEMGVPSAMTNEFFTERFKTFWCPLGAQHDWQHCMYAHTYQDVRRPPSLGYGHELCPYWSKKETTLAYSQRCPLGPRCAYAHGAKELLYHPAYYRTLVCRDLQRRRCPRKKLCAFYHRRSECRTPNLPEADYTRPLCKKTLPQEWLQYFLSPPHFQEVHDSLRGNDNGFGGGGGLEQPAAASVGCRPYAPFWTCNGDTTRLVPSTQPLPQQLGELGAFAQNDDLPVEDQDEDSEATPRTQATDEEVDNGEEEETGSEL